MAHYRDFFTPGWNADHHITRQEMIEQSNQIEIRVATGIWNHIQHNQRAMPSIIHYHEQQRHMFFEQNCNVEGPQDYRPWVALREYLWNKMDAAMWLRVDDCEGPHDTLWDMALSRVSWRYAFGSFNPSETES